MKKMKKYFGLPEDLVLNDLARMLGVKVDFPLGQISANLKMIILQGKIAKRGKTLQNRLAEARNIIPKNK